MTYSCKPSSFGITPPWDSPPLPSPNEANVCTMRDSQPAANPETWKFEWSDAWSEGIDPEAEEHQFSIRFSNCWKPLVVLSPSRSDTTDSTMFSNHCRPRSVEGVDAM